VFPVLISSRATVAISCSTSYFKVDCFSDFSSPLKQNNISFMNIIYTNVHRRSCKVLFLSEFGQKRNEQTN
jgi:hypothetical protein